MTKRERECVYMCMRVCFCMYVRRCIAFLSSCFESTEGRKGGTKSTDGNALGTTMLFLISQMDGKVIELDCFEFWMIVEKRDP